MRQPLPINSETLQAPEGSVVDEQTPAGDTTRPAVRPSACWYALMRHRRAREAGGGLVAAPHGARAIHWSRTTQEVTR
jgi:hypothetical protein